MRRPGRQRTSGPAEPFGSTYLSRATRDRRFELATEDPCSRSTAITTAITVDRRVVLMCSPRARRVLSLRPRTPEIYGVTRPPRVCITRLNDITRLHAVIRASGRHRGDRESVAAIVSSLGRKPIRRDHRSDFSFQLRHAIFITRRSRRFFLRGSRSVYSPRYFRDDRLVIFDGRRQLRGSRR